jgi:hypothetical protein
MSLPAVDSAHLHTRRCVRHPEREAAARCRACGGFFCRECVVEHEGRLLCAPCLARVTAKSGRRRERLAIVRRGFVTLSGIAALWLTWYAIGIVLLRLPPNFHDGTIWRDLSAGPP